MIIPIRFAMNNVFLVKGDKGSVLVDTGMKMKIGSKPQADVIFEKLCENVNPEDIKLIIITHAHADHFGNLSELKKKISAPVLIHELDAMSMEKGENAPSEPYGVIGKLTVKLFSSGEASGKDEVKADIVMKSEKMDLKEYGVDAVIIHTPGHTRGSISVLTADGKALTGDLFMSILRKNTPGYPFFIYDMDIWRESAKKIIDSGVKLVYPSHGNVYSIEKIKKRFSLR